MPYYIKRKKKTNTSDSSAVGKVKRKPDLIKKLDEVFSQYIRLRDCNRYGYFVCISCGQMKAYSQADCGHFHSRMHMNTRFDERNCHAECSHCLTPDALVLTDDLRWVKLGDIQEGQGLFAFEEERTTGQARYWKRGFVTHIHREIQDVYEVELENGDIIKTTAEHQWLARSRSGHSYQWVATKDLWVNGYNLQGKRKTGPHTDKTTSVVCKPFKVIEQEQSYDAGWLAGMLDADGHICQQNIHNADGSIRYGLRTGIAQSSHYPEICDRIVNLIEHFTNNHKPCRQWMDKNKTSSINGREIVNRVQAWQFLVTGTNIEKLQFLMRIRPLKICKINVDKVGMIRSRYDSKVKAICYAGKQEIVVMETSTHTFIANGYAMHNCNRFSADHIIGYRENLIKKIGQNEYDMLTIRANQSKKWTEWELETLIKVYKQKVQKLKKDKMFL